MNTCCFFFAKTTCMKLVRGWMQATEEHVRSVVQERENAGLDVVPKEVEEKVLEVIERVVKNRKPVEHPSDAGQAATEFLSSLMEDTKQEEVYVMLYFIYFMVFVDICHTLPSPLISAIYKVLRSYCAGKLTFNHLKVKIPSCKARIRNEIQKTKRQGRREML